MEKENIPYRRLRDKNRGKTGKVSPNLLSSITAKAKQMVQRRGPTIMSQNVNQYLHMVQDSHLKENYIKWAIDLRKFQPRPTQDQEEKEVSVPNTFFKTTQSQNNRISGTKSCAKSHSYNSADFQQVLSRKTGCGSASNESLMSYMTGLRAWKDQVSKETRPSFTTVPFKERKNHPKLIKKEFIRRAKNIEENQQEDALDGSQNYPVFTEKIVKERNYGLTSAFTQGKGRASLPNLAWQMGLRS